MYLLDIKITELLYPTDLPHRFLGNKNYLLNYPYLSSVEFVLLESEFASSACDSAHVMLASNFFNKLILKKIKVFEMISTCFTDIAKPSKKYLKDTYTLYLSNYHRFTKDNALDLRGKDARNTVEHLFLN